MEIKSSFGSNLKICVTVSMFDMRLAFGSYLPIPRIPTLNKPLLESSGYVGSDLFLMFPIIFFLQRLFVNEI